MSQRRTRAEMMEETRAKLVATARNAFAAQGYAHTSMDDLTGEAGLTRGALYHHFGGKEGLLVAVIEQIEAEVGTQLDAVSQAAPTLWDGFCQRCHTYLELALEPEIQRIMLLDGPSVLGDPSQWPSQNKCLQSTRSTIEQLIDNGTVKPVDPEAAAMLLNGAALNAALWLASSANPQAMLPKTLEAFNLLASGFLVKG